MSSLDAWVAIAGAFDGDRSTWSSELACGYIRRSLRCSIIFTPSNVNVICATTALLLVRTIVRTVPFVLGKLSFSSGTEILTSFLVIIPGSLVCSSRITVVGTHHSSPWAPHMTCCFRYAQTQFSGHSYSTLTKVTQIFHFLPQHVNWKYHPKGCR